MKIIITILVVLLSLGGGAYYAQDSGLYDFKQLKQYIPSQVQELLSIEDAEVVSVLSDDLEVISDTNVDTAIGKDTDQNFRNSTQDSLFESQIKEETVQQLQPEGIHVGSGGSDVVKSVIENVIENKEELFPEINQEIQTAMLDNSSNTPKEKSSVEVLDASPEEMKMVNELNKIESKIVKLDNEKEDLEVKYNKMIKKNRELAMKIKKIDHQIKAIDSQ